MRTAWEYVRISTEEQSNWSILGQGSFNQDYARMNDIVITKTFTDDGYSAKDFNRPAWRDLENQLKVGPKPDFLIVWKFDRMTRDFIPGILWVENMEKILGVTLISTTENSGLHASDPLFFKQRAQLFLDADFERRRISDRTKMGLWSGKSQGRYLGLAPFGYINAKDENKNPIIIINPEQRAAIEGIFSDFLAGLSFAQILVRAREKGFKQTGHLAIQRVLQNDLYAGLIRVKAYRTQPEKIVKGLHEAIVTEDTFIRARYMLEEKLKPITAKLVDANLPLRGFIRCAVCNEPHTGAKCKGRSGYYYYYWCNHCRGMNYRAEQVHETVEDVLSGLSLRPELLEALRHETNIELEAKEQDNKIMLSRLMREVNEKESSLISLEEKYINAKIDDETYNRWNQVYRNDLDKRKIELSDLQNRSKAVSSAYKPYLEYIGDLKWLYQNASVTDKAVLLKSIFPAGLTPVRMEKRGSKITVRTAFLMGLFTPNLASVEGLLEVKKETGGRFSPVLPLGVLNGNEIEPLLRVIAQIVKAA